MPARITDRAYAVEGKRPVVLIIPDWNGIDEYELWRAQRLAKMGCYKPLKTTFPALSPVAWSSFSTGSRPARHNIYDFLDRDRRTYLPVLSS